MTHSARWAAAALALSVLGGLAVGPAADAAAAPRVTGLSVTSGATAGGTWVTVSGSGFVGTRAVLFGRWAGSSVHTLSSTRIAVRTPRQLAGTVAVQVQVAQGSHRVTSAASPSVRFTYVAPPQVSAVRTATGGTTGATTGGGAVTLTGHNLYRTSRVTFGGVPATSVHTVSSTAVTMRAPAHAAGTVAVQFVGGYGASPTDVRYTYVAPPAITAVSRASGDPAGGETLTLTGRDLYGTTGVTFGGVPASSVHTVSPTAVTLRVPAHPAGTVAVQYAGAYGASATARYTYLAAPAAPAPVTRLASTSTDSAVTLRWADPEDSSLDSVVVRRADGDTPPAAVTDGTAVGAAEPGTQRLTDTGLAAGQRYSYAVFAHGAGGYAPAATLTTSTLATAGPGWTAAGAAFGAPRGAPAAVSCPSTTSCVAVDAFGNAFTRSGGAWSGPTALAALDTARPGADVSCASATSCLATLGDARAFRFDGTRWSRVDDLPGGESVTALSCLAAGCVATTDGGHAVTLDAAGWHDALPVEPADDGGTLDELSCTSATFCLAADDWGQVFAFDGSRWTRTADVTDGTTYGLRLACASATRCIAVLPNNDVTVFGFDGTAWTPAAATPPSGLTPLDVTCVPGATSCLVVGANATATYDGSAFGAVSIAPTALTGAASCAAADACAALTADGASARTSAGWGADVAFDPTTGGLRALTCTSGRFCAAADQNGNVATFRDGAWSAPKPVGAVVESIACGSATACLAVSAAGATTWNGSTWTSDPNGPTGLVLAACGAATCLAVTADGATFSRGPGGWRALGSPLQTVDDLTCVSDSFCLAVGEDQAYNPVSVSFDGTAWAAPVPMAGYASAVACASAQRCLAIGDDGASAFDGAAWAAPTALGADAYNVACDPTSCVVAGSDGVSRWDGALWSSPVQPGGTTPSLVACAADGLCLAGDAAGNTYVTG